MNGERLFGLIFAIVVAISSPVLADSYREPRTGAPALSVEAPAGWTAHYDDHGNLQFLSADHAVAMQLSVVEGAEANGALATGIFKAAGLPAYTSSEPATIDQRPGDAYMETKTNPRGVVMDLRVVIVRVDTGHAVVLTTVKAEAAPAEDTATLAGFADRVRLLLK